MKRIYNTGFEVEPRMILIAANYPSDSFSEDMFVILDFMAVYGHEFLETMQNLHGDNGFKFSEITARRQVVRESVRKLVLKGFLNVSTDNGFKYSISSIGKQYSDSFESSYAIQYKRNLVDIYQYFSSYDEQRLYSMLRAKTVKEGGEGQ